MQDENPDLARIPGDAERVEGQMVREQVGNQHADTHRKRQLAQTFFWFFPVKRGEEGQCCAARAEAKQCNADDHESEVIELRHRKQPRQVDLECQRGGREEEEARQYVARFARRSVCKCHSVISLAQTRLLGKWNLIHAQNPERAKSR